MTTMLKFQDTDVLEFDFDENIYVIHDADFLPFLLRDRIQSSIGMDHLSMNEKINALHAESFRNRCKKLGLHPAFKKSYPAYGNSKSKHKNVR